ncbi:MAG: AAA family ATPase, partial [Proteobacteria bacterium]|nr:AAA family ATPase [Pseudomonadota bacterium]
MTEAPNFTSHTRQVGQVYAPSMSVGEISKRLAQQAETVAAHLLPNGKRDGMHWVIGSIYGNEGESLKVVLSGEKAGRWMDHNDKQHHGDLIDLFQFTQNVEKGEAVKAAKEFLGIQDGKPTQRAAKPKPQTGVIKPPPVTWKGMKKIHTWDYTSEGQKIGSVVRYEDDQGHKEVIPFFQPNGKSGIPKELSMPLYGRTNPAYVFVTEGEKDVDAVLQLGLAAVTSQGGSQAARKADWSALKSVGKVFLLPDNDKAGQGYVRDVIAILQAQNAERELKVIDLDGLPEKGDIVDWIQARIPDWDGYDEDGRIAGLKDELRTLVGDAKCIQPPPLHHCNLINMAAVEMEPVEWLWPGRFPLGKLCLLGGKPGVGKTQIALSIAAIVTIGG